MVDFFPVYSLRATNEKASIEELKNLFLIAAEKTCRKKDEYLEKKLAQANAEKFYKLANTDIFEGISSKEYEDALIKIAKEFIFADGTYQIKYEDQEAGELAQTFMMDYLQRDKRSLVCSPENAAIDGPVEIFNKAVRTAQNTLAKRPPSKLNNPEIKAQVHPPR